MDKEDSRQPLNDMPTAQMLPHGTCLTPWLEKVRKGECTLADIPKPNLKLQKGLPAYLRYK